MFICYLGKLKCSQGRFIAIVVTAADLFCLKMFDLNSFIELVGNFLNAVFKNLT